MEPKNEPLNEDLIKPGTELFGYRVLEFVGEGAGSYVYKAQHPTLPMFVAIKQLKPEWVENQDALQRFLREADIVARLNHPNIVRIFDLRYDQDGNSHYIVTEFAENGTLADRLEQAPEGLPVDEVIRLAMGVCNGLETVHRRGIVHRDIKPSNVLLFEAGEGKDIPKLSDFGIARAPSVAGMAPPHSVGVYGSLHYMSPEQLDEDAEVDQRSDLYAMGVLLYSLLTGQVPFAGDAHEVFWAHMYVSPKPPREFRADIPENLEQVVLQALRKDRQERYQSAADMHEALRAVVDISIRRERQSRFEALLERGLACVEEGKWETAIESLRRADVLEPGNAQVQEGLLQARDQQKLGRLYDLGIQHLEAEDWEEAQEYLAQVMGYDPDYAGGRAREGLERASQALERKRRRRGLMVRYRTGVGHLRHWRWERAIAELEQVVAEDPEFEDAADRLEEARRCARAGQLFELALLHKERGEWEEAVNLLEEVRLLKPPHIDVTEELQDVSAKWAVSRGRQQLAAWYEEGVALQKAGDLEQARLRFKRVHDRQPGYLDVADRLEEIEWQIGLERLFAQASEREATCDWGGAIEAYRRILEADQYNRKATRRLARAQRCADRGGAGGLLGLATRVEGWWGRRGRRARIAWAVVCGLIVVGLCFGTSAALGVPLPFAPTVTPTHTPTETPAITPSAVDTRISTVAVAVSALANTVPPTCTPTFTPTWTPSPTPCVPRLELVTYLTIPDRATLVPGSRFTMTWVLRSANACPWPEGSRLVFVEGERMGGPDEQDIGPLLGVTGTVTVSVPLVAPASDGEHEGVWQVQDADGLPVSQELPAVVVVSRPPTSTPAHPPPEPIGIDIMGCNVTFKWNWPGTLAADEYFAVRTGIGAPGHSRVWTKDSPYTLSLKDAGNYVWQIAICRGDPAQHHCEQLAASDGGSFWFQGCDGNGDGPTPPPP